MQVQVSFQVETSKEYGDMTRRVSHLIDSLVSTPGVELLYTFTDNITALSVVYDLIDKDRWSAAEEELDKYVSIYGDTSEAVRARTHLSISRPEHIAPKSNVGRAIELTLKRLGTEDVIFLVYSQWYGESDEAASVSAKEDIEKFFTSGPRPIYFFGNLTYLNEWRIAQMQHRLAGYELVAFYEIDGSYNIQRFIAGKTGFWPWSMSILDAQLDQLIF